MSPPIDDHKTTSDHIPLCPKCGKPGRVNWLDVGHSGPFIAYVPGSVECVNPECPNNPGWGVTATKG